MITRLSCLCALCSLCIVFVFDARADYSTGTLRRPGYVGINPENGDRTVDVTSPPPSMPDQQAPIHIYPQLGGYGSYPPSPGANSSPGGLSPAVRPPYGGKPPYVDRPSYGTRPPYGGKPPYVDRPPYGTRPPYGGKPPYINNRPPYGGKPPYVNRPPYGTRPPYGGKPGGAPPRPGDSRPLPFPAFAR